MYLKDWKLYCFPEVLAKRFKENYNFSQLLLLFWQTFSCHFRIHMRFMFDMCLVLVTVNMFDMCLVLVTLPIFNIKIQLAKWQSDGFSYFALGC
jgi:hypothetical protein